ncbi:MAG: M24 family metallopeptidase [Verrucomicrobiales bacterium]|nr:Xaa-Pro peptidase family protein [Verrucomicrobiota bacterium JB025]
MPSKKSTAAAKSAHRPKSILFHSDASDPDMLYFSRFTAFDPYFAFSIGKKKIAIAPDMEANRMAEESCFDEILLLSEIRDGAAKRFKLPAGQIPDSCQLVRHIAALHRISGFTVAPRFPAGLAFELRDAGIHIDIAPADGIFPQRLIKTPDEVEALRKGNRASAAGFRAVAKTLAESKIKRGQLVHDGKILTSQRLHEIISIAALAEGAVALHTIAAGGDQACDCHNAGSGPIRAGELIVVDIFPQRPSDGYWGDMTRTFLKGKASDGQKRLVRTVKKAHAMTLDMIKPGVVGSKVHHAVEDFFTAEGYETSRAKGDMKGFFHSLGHGVGLQVHEAPNIGLKGTWRFKKGMVVTTEPGLYYRGLGGVRIEDMLHLVPGGNEPISKAPYKWQFA